MGRKSDFIHDVRLISDRIGGHVGSITHRRKVGIMLTNFMIKNNINLPLHVAQIKAEVLPQFASYLKERYPHPGTLQNKMGALRSLLKGARVDYGAFKSNSSVGLPARSRGPGKLPFPDERLQQLYEDAAAEDEGFMHCLKLERLLGARGLEALMSVKTFSGWLKSATESSAVTFKAGTKGGRPRITELIAKRKEETLQALRSAIRYADGNDGKLMIGAADTLSSARSLYHRRCRKIGMIKPYSPHSLRYAYCVDKIVEMLDMGYTMPEACREASVFLGHGAGRGRYARTVYGATVPDRPMPKGVMSLLDRLGEIAQKRQSGGELQTPCDNLPREGFPNENADAINTGHGGSI